VVFHVCKCDIDVLVEILMELISFGLYFCLFLKCNIVNCVNL